MVNEKVPPYKVVSGEKLPVPYMVVVIGRGSLTLVLVSGEESAYMEVFGEEGLFSIGAVQSRIVTLHGS